MKTGNHKLLYSDVNDYDLAVSNDVESCFLCMVTRSPEETKTSKKNPKTSKYPPYKATVLISYFGDSEHSLSLKPTHKSKLN